MAARLRTTWVGSFDSRNLLAVLPDSHWQE